MNKCKFCGGKYKNTTKEHVLKTRHNNRTNMVIENLPVLECSICAHVILPESSEKVIEMLRQRIRREMQEIASQYQHVEAESQISRWKRAVLKLIG